MNDAKKPFPDPLVRQSIFPEPGEIFDFAPISLLNALKDGLVVIDTNVLLVPYTTGKASLEQIRRAYQRLTQEGRLRIPAQVAREFADNRAEKLKVLFQQLSRKRDISLARSEYPLLEGIAAYSDMVKREEEISKGLAEYRNKIGELLDIVAGWQWNDPVSNIYRDLFNGPTIIEPKFNRDELLAELKYRQEHRIPPGFKDATNEYSGVGDLLIWKTILHIGEQESRHLIFVSGDEKADWRYQSENQALYPRFELLDEYRRASQGKSLLIISFAQLLEQLGAPAPVVAEIKQEEAAASLAGAAVELRRGRGHEAERAVLHWLMADHPERAIESNQDRFPDFIVRKDDGLEGYEVKYIDTTSHAFRRVREYVIDVSRRSEAIELSTGLVIVLDGAAASEAVVGRISWELTRVKKNTFLSKVIVGYLTIDNRFKPQYRIDLEN